MIWQVKTASSVATNSNIEITSDPWAIDSEALLKKNNQYLSRVSPSQSKELLSKEVLASRLNWYLVGFCARRKNREPREKPMEQG